jgi:putative intracellular protease/amidase
VRDVELDGFLSHKVILLRQGSHSVRDVIKFAADVAGGVHHVQNPEKQKLLADFAQADKAIAAVCHGPVALINVVGSDGTPLVAGKRITAFTNEEEFAVQLDKLMPFLLETKLRELGSQFVTQPNFSDHIERDGKLITGQNPQSSKSVAMALIEAMEE